MWLSTKNRDQKNVKAVMLCMQETIQCAIMYVGMHAQERKTLGACLKINNTGFYC